jgi:hypothetical protein
LALRKDCGNETLVGLFDLSLDAWPDGAFEMSAPGVPAAIHMLHSDGSWEPVGMRSCELRKGVMTLAFPRPVALETPLFLKLAWKLDRT